MKLLSLAVMVAWLASARQQSVQPSVQSAGQAAPQNTFSIGGVAVNAATNAPMAKALVRIALAENPNQYRMVITGPDGRFLFTNLPARKFALTVERQSGPPHAFLADGQYSTAIVTGPDQDTTHLIFPYHMPGIISGKVVDANGEPVPNAQIVVFARTIMNGLPRLSSSGLTQTRSSGAFTVPHLTPGTYFVGVSARPWFANGSDVEVYSTPYGRRLQKGPAPAESPSEGPSSREPQFDVAYPFTYYPGTADASAASPIVVSEGGTNDVDLLLRAVPAAHVRVTGFTPNTNIFAIPIGPDGEAVPGGGSSMIAENGEGEMTGLAPGRYQIIINSFSRRSGESTGTNHKVVDVFDGMTIDASATSHISVKASVKFKGNERPQNTLSLLLQNDNGNGARGVLEANDTFQFPPSLSPGRYRLLLPNTPAFRAEALEAKGGRIIGGEVILEDSSDVTLNVVIAPAGKEAKLEGFAIRDGKPVFGAMVLLIPQAPDSPHTIGRDQTDSDGSFAIANVAPGQYWALAIDDGHDLAYADPAVMKPYLNSALSVTIADTAQLPNLKVPVQARQR